MQSKRMQSKIWERIDNKETISYTKSSEWHVGFSERSRPTKVALTLGSCTAGICEPGQVRNEAALSRSSWVMRGCLGRANCEGNGPRCARLKRIERRYSKRIWSFFYFYSKIIIRMGTRGMKDALFRKTKEKAFRYM